MCVTCTYSMLCVLACGINCTNCVILVLKEKCQSIRKHRDRGNKGKPLQSHIRSCLSVVNITVISWLFVISFRLGFMKLSWGSCFCECCESRSCTLVFFFFLTLVLHEEQMWLSVFQLLLKSYNSTRRRLFYETSSCK